MKLIIYSSAFLFLFFLSSKVILAQEKQSQTIKDIDQDGFVDSIFIHSSAGSGYASKFCKIVNGRTKEVYTLSIAGSFAEIWQKVSIPTLLLKKEHKAFKQEMETQLFPKKKASIDPSLAWIRQALKNQKKLTNHPYLDWQIDQKLQWFAAPIEQVTSYFVEQNGQYYVYFGHNHFDSYAIKDLQLVAQNKTYKIYKTKHALLLEKDKQQAWIFITDQVLTGAPSKLRWSSIGKLRLIKNHLLLEHLTPTNSFKSVFLINLATGKCSRIKQDLNYELQTLEDNLSKILDP